MMDIKNVKFISAGAGSGKTYTLTEELYKKIADKKYKPSEIVLTTFTRAAANEFKERARAKLIERGCFEEADLLAGATIGTIHSVCLSFLKKYWYRNGRAVVPQEISEKDRDAYISRSLLSVVTVEDIGLFNGYRDEFDIRDADFQKNYGWWKTYLERLISEAETFGVNDFEESRLKSFEMIDCIFGNDKESVSDEEWQTLRNYLTFCDASSVANARNHIAPLKNLIDRRDKLTYSDIAQLYKIVQAPGDVRNLRKQTDLHDSITRLPDSLLCLLSSKKYGAEIKEVVKRLFDLAAKWKEVYASYKKENGLIDYNDMELQFLNLLEDCNVVDEIRSNVKLVMVDEFQDCNQTQIRIFEKLSAVAEESIWVGDPKQAIYGFRGSDTELTNAITDIFANISNDRSGEGDLSFEKLGESYRSVPEIVTFVNNLFTETFGQYGLKKEMVTLEPHRKNEHGKVACWKVAGKNAGERAAKVASKIRSLIDNEGKKPGDIAILVMKNTSYAGYAEALTKLGIPINMGAENLSDYAEVQMLAAVLKYVLNSGNDLAKAEIMRLFTDRSSGEIITDRIGWLSVDCDGDGVKRNEWLPDGELFRKLDYVAAQVKTQSVSDAVKGVITLLSLRRKSEQWGSPVARKARLDRVVSMAKEYEDSCLKNGRAASLNGFLLLLTGGRLYDDSSDVSTNAEGVTICTYHKSKGLQWNTVILDGLCVESYDTQTLIDRNIIGVHAVRNSLPAKDNLYVDNIITCLPAFLSMNLPETMEESLTGYVDMFREKTMKEYNRVYYVGMTRAKDELVILLSGRTDKNDLFHGDFYSIDPIIPIEEKRLKERLADCIEELPQVDPEEIALKYEVLEDSLGKESGNMMEKYISPSHYKWQEDRAGVMANLLWRTEKIAPNKHLIQMNDVDDPEKMAAAGTCIHNVFAAYRPDFSDEDNIATAERIVSLSLMDTTFMDKSQIVASAKEAYSFLEQEYGKGRALKEVPFSMKDEESGVVYTGEIDLVWDLGGGRCVLVDYKSYPGFDLEAHAKEYAGQLTLYRKALESAGYSLVSDPLIYFNTHGAFVRVGNGILM